MSEAIRATVLDRYQSVVDPENTDTVPWQLHGHAVPSGQQKPYQLARYLTLGNVGGRYSDGRIHGCAIWLPPNIEPSVEEGLRRALWGWSSLRSRTVSTEVEPYEGELRPWSTVPKRWTGPAIRWRSVTPIVAETGVKKRGPNLEQVQRWFRNAGHEPPSDIEVSPAPRIPGAQRLRPSQVHHHRERSAYPYFWIDARFDAEVEGPLCVGRGRHLGMGLLAPVHTRGDQLHKESQR